MWNPAVSFRENWAARDSSREVASMAAAEVHHADTGTSGTHMDGAERSHVEKHCRQMRAVDVSGGVTMAVVSAAPLSVNAA